MAADPAAEEFEYPVSLDVRDLITLEDVMEELELGPNGYGPGFNSLPPSETGKSTCIWLSHRKAGHYPRL